MDSILRKLRYLIGVPFVSKGRDPETGLDCFGLFLCVMKEFGLEIPGLRKYDGQDAFDCRAIYFLFLEEIGNWEKIEVPEPGCGIALSIDPDNSNCISHFGVYIGEGKFIHTLKSTGVIVSRVSDYKYRIRGFYKWNNK